VGFDSAAFYSVFGSLTGSAGLVSFVTEEASTLALALASTF
jgi:hypothetical protein